MTKITNPARRFAALKIAAGCAILASACARASVWLPTSGEHSWHDAANWSDGVVPNSTSATADFAIALNGDLSVVITNTVTLKGLILGASNGGGKITLHGGTQGELSLLKATIVQTATSKGDEIAVAVKSNINDRFTVVNQSSEPLLISGKITFNSSNKPYFILNEGTLILGGMEANSQTGAEINGGVLICDKPAGIIALPSNTTVNNGILRFNNTDQAKVLTVNGGIVDLNGYSQSLTSLNGSGGVITTLCEGDVTLGLVENSGSNYAGVITDGGEGRSLSVTLKQNVKTFSGMNTYYGTTKLEGGGTVIGSDQALGVGMITISGGHTLRGLDTRTYALMNDMTLNQGNWESTFGSADTGTLKFGRLTYTSGHDARSVLVLSELTFTNVLSTTRFPKGGAGALIVEGDIEMSGSPYVRIAAGMFCVTGNYPSAINTHVFGDTATFGGKGEKQWTLGTANGQFRWSDAGGFSGYGGDLAVTLNNGAALEWSSTPHFVANGPLVFGHARANGTATLVNDITLRSGTNLVNALKGNAAIDGRLAGNITGNSGAHFVKDGNGVLSLAGAANSWPGVTEVRNGTLRIDGGLSGTESVSVLAGAALCGTGTVATAGGVVIDGALCVEPGTCGLTIDGDLHVNGSLAMSVAETTAAVNVSGALSIAPAATLVITRADDGAPWPTSRRVLLRGNPAMPVDGWFAGLPEGTRIELDDGVFWTISYTSGRVSVGPYATSVFFLK